MTHTTAQQLPQTFGVNVTIGVRVTAGLLEPVIKRIANDSVCTPGPEWID